MLHTVLVQRQFGLPTQRDWEDAQIDRIDGTRWMNGLREEDRRLLMLHWMGFSYVEIARVVGRSKWVVRTRLITLRDKVTEYAMERMGLI